MYFAYVSLTEVVFFISNFFHLLSNPLHHKRGIADRGCCDGVCSCRSVWCVDVCVWMCVWMCVCGVWMCVCVVSGVWMRGAAARIHYTPGREKLLCVNIGFSSHESMKDVYKKVLILHTLS